MLAGEEPSANVSCEQKRIVTLPASCRALVLAGPGTGKTHTLLHRLLFLVGHEGLAARREILVLSFARAAVAEIRSRLSTIAREVPVDAVRFVNVRTFDSFATRLLLWADDKADLSDLGYDARISLAATKLSQPGSSLGKMLGGVRHVVVDEIQDLVGVRARLVQAVLTAVDGGFTLLGDPAQGIFDYLVRDHRDGPTSIDFLDWVRSTWRDGLLEYTLARNWRTQSRAADVAGAARRLVLAGSDEGTHALGALSDIIRELPEAGSVATPQADRLLCAGQRTAVLCRTNAEVLYTSSQLIEAGIQCTRPPKVEERGLPAWVARVLGTYTSSRITQSTFTTRWAKLIGDGHPPGPEAAWRLLKVTEGCDRDDLDLEVLRTRLRHGYDWVFDSEGHRSSGVIVTTVHQSKGREYDRVIVLPPRLPGAASADSALEEARVLYVAATRARELVMRLDGQGLPVMCDVKQPSRRSRIVAQTRQGGYFLEVGVPGDIEEESPVNTSLLPTPGQASVLQRVIWHSLAPGTPLALVAQQGDDGLRFIVAWRSPATGGSIPIACMDHDFKVDLETCLRTQSVDGSATYLPVMHGLVVAERTSIVLPAYPQSLHEPYARSGFCLNVNVRGLVRIS